jgi:hypothetical protein
MSAASLLVAALLAGPAGPSAAADPPQPWAGLLGSGLLTLHDTETLQPGRFSVAFTVDNRDRDPLGLDLVDGALAWNVGVTRWAEFYGHHVFSRGVAVPDTPVLPPPPLDAIVPPRTSLPGRPYYSLYSPTPYVDDSGPIRFGSDIPGEVVFGAKARGFAPRGARPGLAWSLQVQIPLTKELRYLQAGAGTGGIDVGLGTIAEWRVSRWNLVGSAVFTRIGQPAYPDRRIESRDGVAVATDEALVLPHRLDVGVGARRTLSRWLAAVGELSTVFEVGARTRALDRARPVDGLLGLQLRWKALRVTGALRYHGNTPQSMEVRRSPLAGLVDVTKVDDADLADYMRQVGLDGGESLLRPGTHRLLVPVAGGPALPAGSRVIPDTYRIRSEHQIGYLVLAGLSF